MSVGPFQIVIIALVLLLLFGRGRISEMMGDVGKGVKSFRQGLADGSSSATTLDGVAHEAKAEPVRETTAG